MEAYKCPSRSTKKDRYLSRIVLIVVVPLLIKTSLGECLKGRIIDSGHLSCTQKQFIVDLHNKLREQVASGKVSTQPPAANMIELRWSEPLGQKAQKWSDGCVFSHDPELMLEGHHIGQNLAQESSTKDVLINPDFVGMINNWFNEVYKYGYNGSFSYDSGHYSQIIWGETKYVGCGITYYYKQVSYYSFLVCNYYPPGNWAKQKAYVYGKRNCSLYNLVNSKTYPSLCAVDGAIVNVCQST